MTSYNKDRYQFLSGTCPDEKCQARLYFPSYDTSIECTHCGQRHARTMLRDVQEVSNPGVALHNMIKNIIVSNISPKRPPDMVKVLGLSNYHCKLLSPFLTKYGMDKKTGEAKLLRDMNQGEMFDCGLFGDRAFRIDPEHVPIVGYGRDISGSSAYLAETLSMVKSYNEGREVLVPIHSDGDGHCLVHAVSRALIGRELFWHPLRCNLKEHFIHNLAKYKELFKDFIDVQEWKSIVAECDPNFLPPEGELLGLRNIHVFGLANVLKRPIILLDSVAGMQSLGDYAALFLPGLVKPEDCRGKDGHLNKPLCIAWNSSGHNHYIPLVGIKNAPLPCLPRSLVPKAWGVPQNLTDKYIEFNDKNCCIIGGDHSLGDVYILRLASAMEGMFMKEYGVHPSLVADVHHYVYSRQGIVGALPQSVIKSTQKAVQERRLYRCMTCDATCEQLTPSDWLRRGGYLYKQALQSTNPLKADRIYPFPVQGIACRYDPVKDELLLDTKNTSLEKCTWCHGSHLRHLRSDGSIEYKMGDRTKTPSTLSRCSCGFKHYWNGKEYDNLPQQLTVSLEWNGKVIRDTVTWFQFESDPTLNSNAYQVGSEVVQKHLPGVFGSERIVQRVVNQILEQTRVPDGEDRGPPIPNTFPKCSEEYAKKHIVTGHKTLHKEELGLSDAEHKVRQRITLHAPEQQKRRSGNGGRKDDMATVSVGSNSCQENASLSESMPIVAPPARAAFVRIVTSDGRQGKLHLDPAGVTFPRLQAWVQEEFQIVPHQQCIKSGFPLREIKPPPDKLSTALALQHGDRVMVEVLPNLPDTDTTTDSRLTGECSYQTTESSMEQDTSSLSNDILRTLEALERSTGPDPLDTDLISLIVTANLAGHTVWDYAKKHPHLFSAGGLFYLQIQRDVGLVDGKHCHLPLLPEKTFRYNGKSDQLELCVEPHGHFPITEDIDKRIAAQIDQNPAPAGQSVGSLLDTARKTSSHVPFQGTGYSLRSVSFPEADVSAAGQPVVRTAESEDKLASQQVPGTQATSQFSTVMTRRGPGFSILSPQAPTPGTFQVEKLQAISQLIQMESAETSEVIPMEEVAMEETREESKENLVVEMQEEVPSSSECLSTEDSETNRL